MFYFPAMRYRRLFLPLLVACISTSALLVSAQTPSVAERTTAGPVNHPQIISIANNTYFINEFGMDAQYLLVGTERALLIDTGTGFYDLPTTLARLTSLPVTVAITHGHPDHAGGMRQFPSVYLNPADLQMALSTTEQGAKAYGEILWKMGVGYPNLWGYLPQDAHWGQWNRAPTVQPMTEGQNFDLGGGRVVTVFCTPGHTPGSCVLLDRRERILFTGDAANPNLLAATMPISTTLRSLLRIKSMAALYDRIYNGHTAYGGSLDAFPQDPRVLDDLISNCRGILSGQIHGKDVPNFLFPERTDTISVLGSAQIHYDPKNLWLPAEPHRIP